MSQLELKYKYSPETPWAPIHELSDGRINRIKQHYWHIWDLGTKVGPFLSLLGQLDILNLRRFDRH